MADSVQKNFRMSPRAIKLLHDVARARGMTETDVVEFCVAKFALEVGQDVERAKELLFEQICRAAANSPVDLASLRVEESAMLNDEPRRGESVQQASEQSAAGTLAITAGETAGRKHAPTKKK